MNHITINRFQGLNKRSYFDSSKQEPEKNPAMKILN